MNIPGHSPDYTPVGACYDPIVRALVVALSLLSSVARAATTIDLYTMGAGDELFSAFGHAAICVTDPATPRGRCYNYGTADFSTPVPLTWQFIRGRALFWVSVVDEPRMLEWYADEGRAVWQQRLPLGDDEAQRVAGALAASTDERVKYYRYHHFDDNCTTRIRDLLDRAGGGRLSRDLVDRGRTFREWAREGFAGNWPLLAAVELLLGRRADRSTDSWQSMFLPSELRAEVASRFGAPPRLVVAGRPRPPRGSTRLGLAALVALGVLLALGLLAGARIGPRSRRLALALTATVLGVVGAILWLLAILSTFPELTRNEALIALWPTDLALPLLGERNLRRYLDLRLVVLALVVVAHLGLLVQPLAPTLLALLPLGAARLALARRPDSERAPE